MPTGIGQIVHVYPVLTHTQTSDGTDGLITAGFVDLFDAESIEFLVSFGVLESSASDGAWTVSVLASSTTTATGAGIAWNYNLSGAVGADTMGGVTAVVSTDSLALTSDATNCVLLVHVNPAEVAGAGSDKRYVYITCQSDTADDNGPTGSMGVIAAIQPRHRQVTMTPTTA